MNVHNKTDISKKWPMPIFLLFISFALLIDFPVADFPKITLVGNAEARIGRPASPNSIAGVHRRTRRRAVRRAALGTRIYTLPVGCIKVIEEDVSYYYCDNIYYRPYYEGSRVVYVVENP